MRMDKRRKRQHRWQSQPEVWHRPPVDAPDPLARPEPRRRWGAWVVAMVVGHGLSIYGTGLAARQPKASVPLPLAVTIVEKAPAAVPAVRPKPVEIHPAPVEPRKKRRRAKRRRRAEPRPAATPKAPTAVKPASVKPRRVVGLRMSSTVAGGSGPAFAVGSTRHGRTARIAEAPTNEASAPPSANRRARARVDDGIERPRRLRRLEPDYPEMYRRRGLEGQVTVELTVTAKGEVEDVRLAVASRHTAFNEAAFRTARRERFRPATRNGAPVPYILRFTYHFRLSS